MKRLLNGCMIICAVMMLFSVPNCVAEERASEAFKITTVAMTSDLYVEFRAVTRHKCETIKISSCTLQEMNGDKVVSSESVTAPSTTASNSDMFTASADYSGDATSGKRYRLKAVFWADGYTVTAYSRCVDY